MRVCDVCYSSTCGFNLCSLSRPTPLYPSQKLVTTEDVFVVQNKSFHIEIYIRFVLTFFFLSLWLGICHSKKSSFAQPSSIQTGIVRPLWCVDWWTSKQTLHLGYQWVYCFAFRSVSSELFIWLPGMKPVKPATLSHNRMCIPSVWPCSNGFVESINSHARTCSHKYTSLCPAHIETNLSFLLSHRQKHIFSLLCPYCSLFPALVLTYTHIEIFCIPILCPWAHLAFKGQTDLLSDPPSPHLQYVIQTSSTQWPPWGRGYTTTRPNCHPLIKQAHKHTQPPPQAFAPPASFLLHPCSHYQRTWTTSALSIGTHGTSRAHCTLIMQHAHTHSRSLSSSTL